MKEYILGKDIQEIKDKLAAIEGRMGSTHHACKECGSGKLSAERIDRAFVRLPRGAKVWLEVGDCSKDGAGIDGHILLRSKSGVRIEVSRSDVEEVKGKTLLRHGAEVHNLRKLNPEMKLNSCRDMDYPNSCLVSKIIDS